MWQPFVLPTVLPADEAIDPAGVERELLIRDEFDAVPEETMVDLIDELRFTGQAGSKLHAGSADADSPSNESKAWTMIRSSIRRYFVA